MNIHLRTRPELYGIWNLQRKLRSFRHQYFLHLAPKQTEFTNAASSMQISISTQITHSHFTPYLLKRTNSSVLQMANNMYLATLAVSNTVTARQFKASAHLVMFTEALSQ